LVSVDLENCHLGFDQFLCKQFMRCVLVHMQHGLCYCESNVWLWHHLQNIDPARRRRRDLWVDNSTLGDPVRVFRTFRVITPDDLDEAVGASTIVNVGSG